MKFKPTPHPIFKLPEPEVLEAMGPEKTRELLDRREQMIQQEREDAFKYGFEPEHWKKAEALLQRYKEVWVMGGNRASKSEFGAKTVNKLLLSGPRKRAWAFSETADNSREIVQPVVWKYLPPTLRALNGKRATIANINYSQKGGFTENTFVLPNGSQEWFRNYAQDIKTIEGGEIDGAWCDELVTIEIVETIRYRLVTRDGFLLVTFTAKEGYTPTVKSILDGARTLEWREAPLLPIKETRGGETVVTGYERLPVVQETKDGKAAIIYFWSEDNPFGGYPRLVKELEGKTRDEILMRAYGIPTKAISARFEIFNDTVHVVRPETIPRDGTNYMLVDPCGGRTWCILWVRVDVAGTAWVYREWPDQDQYIEGVGFPGEWAVPDGKLMDGRKGTAQAGFRFGIGRYKEEIELLESGGHERWRRVNEKTGKTEPEEIFERYMDSRFGNTPRQRADQEVTLIEECEEVGLYFLPTPGNGINDGIDIVNRWLEYDTRRPVDGTNQPRLKVSARCKNLIYALQSWTGKDGKNGATKDWIDLLRYFVLIDPQNVEGEALAVRRGDVS